jgi:hypothetical protein
MFDQIEHQLGRDGDKPVNRIVNDLLFIQCRVIDCKSVKIR